MTTWALIPCSKTKAASPCIARLMYWSSAQFRGAFTVAERNGETPLILSAKHGVLRPHHYIEPYDMTLNTMRRVDRWRWADGVLRALLPRMVLGDTLVSYLGQRYGEFVIPELRIFGFTVDEPLKGMGQGKRLAWFKEQLSPSQGGACLH